MDIRQGFGYDLHRTAPGRPLVLGGLTIPCDFGLSGHSDADVVVHALCDALLGALALGDIGSHFPDNNPVFRGIDSMLLLEQVVEMVVKEGYRVSNVDIVVVAEKPKLEPFKKLMASRIALSIRTDESRVSVKAKTNEGVDATGRVEAIAAMVTVLLIKE